MKNAKKPTKRASKKQHKLEINPFSTYYILHSSYSYTLCGMMVSDLERDCELLVPFHVTFDCKRPHLCTVQYSTTSPPTSSEISPENLWGMLQDHGSVPPMIDMFLDFPFELNSIQSLLVDVNINIQSSDR